MAEIRITTQTLNDTAGKVRNHANTLNDILEQCLSTMVGLESTWQSDTAAEIRANMRALQNKFFTPYKNVVDSYAKFLDDTAATYEQTEASLQKSAEAFR